MSSKLKLDKALRLANKKVKKGEISEAERIYQAVLIEFPQNLKAIAALKRLSTSQFDNAQNAQDPPQGQIRRFIELYEQEKYPELIEACVEKKNQFPTSVAVLNILGLAKSRVGELAAAIEVFQFALSIKPNSAEIYNNMGNTQKRNGDLDSAIVSFNLAIKFRPNYTQALVNLGSAYQEIGELDRAIQSYRQSIKLDSSYVEAHNEMGNALQRLGKLDAAFDCYKRAINLQPDFAHAHNNMGNILNSFGNFQGAIDCYRRALEINPSYVETYNNLGNALKELGNLDEAIENYQRALLLNPAYADGYLSLGNALQDKGDDTGKAIENYQEALRLKPDYAEAYNNMGVALENIGDIDSAIDSYQRALKLNPNYETAYVNLGNILKYIVFSKPVIGLEDSIFQLLRRKKFVNPNDIAIATISLLKHNIFIIKALELEPEISRVSSLAKIIKQLVGVPLFLELLSVSLIPDLEIEGLLKKIRAEVLLNYQSLIGDPEVLAFCTTLALQCFTNEFIYDCSEQESVVLGELERIVVTSLNDGEQAEPLAIACLASYKPLTVYSWHGLLSISDTLPLLKARQLDDPREEDRLRSEIVGLRTIVDDVSSRVRIQYEKNPYPRWVNVGLHMRSKTVPELAKALNLKIGDHSVFNTRDPVILIAGCGTGQHPINSSSRYTNGRFVAVDLSLSSLAYAKRKTSKLKITNIDYIQADILDLESLGIEFDVIESSGVLHHMDDPLVGWKKLISCLKPGGLIRIGLYSELARQHIVRMRRSNSLRQIGASEDEIRAFRHLVSKSNLEDHLKIVRSPDFFSMSTLRDLIFHVQEHRFTIPQIESCLHELELSFCGFELGSETTERKFKLEFSDREDWYDLRNWHAFEVKYPSIFSGMYQFWCQKKLSC